MACKTSWKITCRRIILISSISDLEVIASSKSRPIALKATNSLVHFCLSQRILLFFVDVENKSFMVFIGFEKGFILIIILSPRKRSVPSNYLVGFGPTYCNSIGFVIAELMEFLCLKVMITGPKKEAKLDIEGKESVEKLEVFEYIAVLNFFKKSLIDLGVLVLIFR
jgi:hypothetical protein